jgi:uncharacterized protein (TIGR02266 family)
MSVKTILVAHRHAAVRERFAAALADARHDAVLASTAREAERAVADRRRPVSLVLVDLRLAPDGIGLARTLRHAGGGQIPIVIFSGTVESASQIPALLAISVGGYLNEHAPSAQILPALAPHLFPDNFNRRTSPRIAIGVPVSYRAGATIAGATTLDVGKSGLAIRTMSPLARGTEIEVRFRLPGRSADIEAVGLVAWSDRKVGMGVQFSALQPADEAMLDTFVEQHR